MCDMTSENQIPASPEEQRQIDVTLGLVEVKFRVHQDVYDRYAAESARIGVPIQVLFRQAVS